MAGWKLYTDAACTNEFGGTLQLVHRTDLSDNPQDKLLYYANIDDDPGDNGVIQKQAESNPGTDNITLAIADTDVGSGHEASEITLATSAADLDTNTSGASLSLGTQLLSGVSNKQEIHIRVENAVTTVGTSTELSVDIVATVDSTVTV
ncbi:hypothetical protein SAMN05216571_101272 [Onishia taeanensis]|uniref:Uncharacterized protein n=1 Tax=Onishia taeanensis TaxID=284577 RepID=A0A1G7N7Z3_9GAMM|nr:hypothetical protein [Halomonas taeanensis]SDF70007.1 hypothetical protein SAMN05216571_101272 [Halomonas taeanensis]